jgi:hypothetical protein
MKTFNLGTQGTPVRLTTDNAGGIIDGLILAITNPKEWREEYYERSWRGFQYGHGQHIAMWLIPKRPKARLEGFFIRGLEPVTGPIKVHYPVALKIN